MFGTIWWHLLMSQGQSAGKVTCLFPPSVTNLFIFHFLPWNAKTSSFPSMGFVLQFCYRLKELWMSSFKSSIRFLWIVIWWSQQHHFSPLVPSRVHVIYIYIYIYTYWVVDGTDLDLLFPFSTVYICNKLSG